MFANIVIKHELNFIINRKHIKTEKLNNYLFLQQSVIKDEEI